jgi:uncharacterized protein
MSTRATRFIGAGTALTLLAISACRSRFDPVAAPQQIRIATASRLGVYERLGTALAQAYRTQLPDMTISVLETSGSVFNLLELEEGRADLAFAQADVAYLAFRNGLFGHAQPYERLRAIAVLYMSAVQVIVPRASNIRRLGDLDGRHVGVGPHQGVTEVAANVILQAYGLENRINREFFSFEQTAYLVGRGELDAGFNASTYPNPAIEELGSTIRLLPIEPAVARRVRAEYPFLRPMTIAKGTYTAQSEDVSVMGVDNLLLCRRDLPDNLVRRLTAVFIDSIGTLARAHPAARIDAERASAAPIPIHPGATLFYRERELFR